MSNTATTHKQVRYTERGTKHIVFVNGAERPAGQPRYDHEAAAEFGTRLHHSYGEQGPIHPGWAEQDAAWKRYNRAEVKAMRAAAAEALGIDGRELSFSRKAGCSMCPCSPGFKIEAREGFAPGWATYVEV